MSKGATILVLGFLLAFLPFTGFPNGIKLTFTVFFGVIVMVLGFLVRQERLWLMRAISGEHKTDAYTENGPSFAGTVPAEEV